MNTAKTFGAYARVSPPDADLHKTKQSLLESAVLLIPAGRVLFYEVDERSHPFGHISSTSNEYWGDLYRKFVHKDPFHPKHFSNATDSVFGTAPGFGVEYQSASYVSGFRLPLGVRYKAEVFLRDAQGDIRAGIRYVRFNNDREFSPEEMNKLKKMQFLFASTWSLSLNHSKRAAILSGLTEREHEVLELLLSGYPNQDIANVLSVALPTVKNHVRNILNKTGYLNRIELLAALFGIDRG